MRRRRSPPSDERLLTEPTATHQTSSSNDDDDDRQHGDDEKGSTDNERRYYDESSSSTSFFVAKWVILRLTGLVYFVAFLGAFLQNRGLMGTHGLQPASVFMQRLIGMHESRWDGFLSHPTLFWWINVTDGTMDAVAGIGMILSGLFVVMLQVDSWLIMLSLWMLDFSIVTIAGGTSFYSYGWESQLLETGFLTIFLCDLPQIIIMRKPSYTAAGRGWTVRALWRDDSASSSPPSMAALWLMRWLCFRISMGAGLIKIRGSSCWARKTCLHYHFETQPIPSPLSFVFHFLPKSILTHAVDLDLMVQLYTAWFVLVPEYWKKKPAVLLGLSRNLRRLGGFLQAGFMANIILSGNFAFLNHLTIIPALACLDDACWLSWLQRYIQKSPRPRRPAAEAAAVPSDTPRRERFVFPPRLLVDSLLVLLIAMLSMPVVSNLLQWKTGSRQQMNASFDAFRLVNTYGAFGSVGEARYEPIVSVSRNGRDWTELEFPCKPGNVTRRPCFCAPYHYRLDWNIWFIGFKPHQAYLRQREKWLYTLLVKLLDPTTNNNTERPWLNLLDNTAATYLRQSCYDSGDVPRYAKVDMYHYQMAAPLWRLIAGGKEETVWWNRTFEESLIPPVEIVSKTELRVAKLENQ